MVAVAAVAAVAVAAAVAAAVADDEGVDVVDVVVMGVEDEVEASLGGVDVSATAIATIASMTSRGGIAGSVSWLSRLSRRRRVRRALCVVCRRLLFCLFCWYSMSNDDWASGAVALPVADKVRNRSTVKSIRNPLQRPKALAQEGAAGVIGQVPQGASGASRRGKVPVVERVEKAAGRKERRPCFTVPACGEVCNCKIRVKKSKRKHFKKKEKRKKKKKRQFDKKPSNRKGERQRTANAGKRQASNGRQLTASFSALASSSGVSPLLPRPWSLLPLLLWSRASSLRVMR